MTGKKKRIRLYFHFRSPYSWIGACWIKDLCKVRDLQIEYIPFWEPDRKSLDLLAERGGEHYYTPMSKAKHLYILQDIKRITRKLGYQLKWPVDNENSWWDLPHLGYIYARQQGKAGAYFEQIHHMRWHEGRNICTEEVIAEVARAVDLDADELCRAPEDPVIREEGAAELYKAYIDGVFGIPFFVHGYNKFWGIDRYAEFLLSLRDESTGQDDLLAEHTVPHYQLYDTDHPGGCG